MKVICILGSPKKRGNTATVLKWVEEALRESGHDVDSIRVTDHNIEGCVGCLACQKKPESLECSRKDDALGIFKRLMDADVIVYASPLYCWGFSSQIKPLIDRHLCLVSGYTSPETHKSFLEGKCMAFVVTAAGPQGKGNSDAIEMVAGRVANFAKAKTVAKLIVPFCTAPSDLGEEVKTKARTFARELI